MAIAQISIWIGIEKGRRGFGLDMQQVMQLLTSQLSDEYYTPAWLIDLVRDVLGSIDLDPASCIAAQRIVKANRFYTIADDGLLLNWKAPTLFCNPPYGKTNGKQNAPLWSEKFVREYRKGNFGSGILLVNMTPGYEWFEKLWRIFPVCSLRKKVAFVPGTEPIIKGRNLHLWAQGDEGGEALAIEGDAKKASGIFYAGDDVEKFRAVFEEWGKVVET